jgi:DNA modification methylase
VCDFFSGSGTVLVQASQMERRVIGFEKNPEAFQYIVAQLEELVPHDVKSARKVS